MNNEQIKDLMRQAYIAGYEGSIDLIEEELEKILVKHAESLPKVEQYKPIEKNNGYHSKWNTNNTSHIIDMIDQIDKSVFEINTAENKSTQTDNWGCDLLFRNFDDYGTY